MTLRRQLTQLYLLKTIIGIRLESRALQLSHGNSFFIFHLLSVVETYSRMQICLMKYLAACDMHRLALRL